MPSLSEMFEAEKKRKDDEAKKVKINIDPEFAQLIPPLSQDEREGLEASLVKDGFDPAFPIILWKGHDIIVDGHNRYLLSQKHGIAVKAKEREFASREAVIEWIITAQLNRRNLTANQRLYLIGKLYQAEKKAVGAPEGSNNNLSGVAKASQEPNGATVAPLGASTATPRTKEKVAKQKNVSPRTVINADKFTKAVDAVAANVDTSARDLLSDTIKTTQKDIQKIAEMAPEEQKIIIEKIKEQKPRQAKDMSKIIASAAASKLEKERMEQERKLREETGARAWFEWLACKPIKAIASDAGIDESSIMAKINAMKATIKDIAPASLQTFNIWRFSGCDKRFGTEYPGRIPGQILENLLYYFTGLFDVVVDPFAGGGTTLDVCVTMSRRCLVYDLVPSRPEIAKRDISEGFPPECKGCNFIFLDPPYWDQKKGEYSADATNLANLDEEQFYTQIKAIFTSAMAMLVPGGMIAIIISPTTKGKQKHYHGYEIAKMAEAIGFEIVEWIDVPFGTERATGAHVAKAKQDKVMLTLKRDLVVFKKK